MMSVEERLAKIDERLDKINEELGYIRGKLESEGTLIKWVIFPLLIIVAGLVGIKLVLPA